MAYGAHKILVGKHDEKCEVGRCNRSLEARLYGYLLRSLVNNFYSTLVLSENPLERRPRNKHGAGSKQELTNGWGGIIIPGTNMSSHLHLVPTLRFSGIVLLHFPITIAALCICLNLTLQPYQLER
jgi:hypothetical protein